MEKLIIFLLVALCCRLGDAYSKYGRTCKDIGCLSNEVCVMKQDPCTIYSDGKCGSYPSCQKVSNAAKTCETYICPPTQICRMDGGQPKCFEDPAAAGNKENKRPVQSINPGPPGGDAPSAPVLPPSYPQPNYPQPNHPQNPQNYPNYPHNSNYPQYPQSGVYPNLAPGQTTPRPNVLQPGQHYNGGGYQGGQIGSGYPGQGSGGYVRPGSGYPQQSGGYPQQGGGYPQQGGGYPQQGGGYYQGGYPNQNTNRGGYPTQGGGHSGSHYNQNRYGQRSGQDSSNPLLDKVTDTLKTLGKNFLKDQFNIRL